MVDKKGIRYDFTERKREGKFIKQFTNTPEGIYCPHFWVLIHGNGCPFECSYCFLLGTFRNMINFNSPTIFNNYEDMKKEVANFLKKETPSVLSMGELSDSLAYDLHTGISKLIVPMFAEQKRHKLLMLSKSGPEYVDNLLQCNHNKQTIISFSINAIKASEQFEGKAPSTPQRIQAAKRLFDAGYPVRFRIDPMLPIREWEQDYVELVHIIKQSGIIPERFTLGSLRYFPAVKNFSKYWNRNQAIWDFKTIKDGSDKRHRLLMELRIQMYSTVINEIKSIFPISEIGICKETDELRKRIGFTEQDNRCNCTL